MVSLADEFKVHRHVYYGCTKVRDKECKCGYINEQDLLKQFELLMDKINLDEIGIKERIFPLRRRGRQTDDAIAVSLGDSFADHRVNAIVMKKAEDRFIRAPERDSAKN